MDVYPSNQREKQQPTNRQEVTPMNTFRSEVEKAFAIQAVAEQIFQAFLNDGPDEVDRLIDVNLRDYLRAEVKA